MLCYMVTTIKKIPVFTISVIVTTYNWPQALSAVLSCLEEQSYKNFEVLIADDGSDKNTAELIKSIRKHVHFPLQHIWHEDDGFRAGAIRNRAVAATKCEYLVFLDGDCLVRPDFLALHSKFSNPTHFVVGNRAMLSKAFSQRILDDNMTVQNNTWWQWLINRYHGDIKRVLPILRLPLGLARRMRSHRWQGAKTCNLGVWRKDFLKVNGFDEKYQGWGYEDSDFVIRLIRAGMLRIDGHYALAVLHLWHPEHSRQGTEENLDRLNTIQTDSNIRAADGLDKYLS